MIKERLIKEGKWVESEYSLTKTDIYEYQFIDNEGELKKGYKVSEKHYDPDTEKLEETFDYYVIFNDEDEVVEFSLDATGYNYYWSGTSSFRKKDEKITLYDIVRISNMICEYVEEKMK